uniref:Uncharacterized protein n=1 Tax=Globodera rostochiensis TaxID=31243 RepID=A0A914HK30_GLORO
MRDAADTLHGQNVEIGPNKDRESTSDQDEGLEHLLVKLKQNELELKGMKQLEKRMQEIDSYRRHLGSFSLLVLFISAAAMIYGVSKLEVHRLSTELKQLLALWEMIVKLEIKTEECQKQQLRTIVDLQNTVAVLNYTINGIGMYAVNDEIEPNNDMELKEKLKDEESWFKACTRGHLDTVKLFVENGQDIEAQKRDGVTGLMLASAFGKPNVVRFLLSKGARTERRDAKGVFHSVHTQKRVVAQEIRPLVKDSVFTLVLEPSKFDFLL